MSYVVRASLFAGGLVVGAGGAVLLNRKNASQQAVAVPSAVTRIEKPSSTTDVIPTLNTVAQVTPSATDALGPAGYPGPVADFLKQIAYVSSYDRRLRHPSWTAEHITAATLQRPDGGRPDRNNSTFKEDDRIPQLFRAKLADYFKSGYDRGHMVPAADAKRSQEAMNETFYLSNVAPQVGAGMNRDYWAHTEDFVRRLTSRFADVYVFTIPLYLPRKHSDGKWRVSYEVIGNPPNVSVPTHFAKVILGVGSTSVSNVGLASNGDLSLGAFVMPNAMIPNEAPLTSFQVPIEQVEKAAGLTLFPPAIKNNSKKLCETVKCQIVVREFANKVNSLPLPK